MASPPIELNLVTWNVNGQSTRGSQARRDFVISHVLRLERKLLDIAFFQEVTNRKHAETKWGITGGYYSIHEERKGIYQAIWSHGEHTIREVINMEKEAHRLIPDRATDAPTALEDADRAAGFSEDLIIPDDKDRRLMRSDIPPRVHALKLLIRRKPRMEIIAVTFHSIYRYTYRNHYILLFFNLMCRLADKHQCPVLIGGDFNLDVEKWKNYVEGKFKDRVNISDYYKPTPRRIWKERIDTFAIVHPYPASIHVHTCMYIAIFEGPPVATDPFPPEDNQYELRCLLPPGKALGRTLEKDLDHDPVKVTVKLVDTHGVIQMLLMGALVCLAINLIIHLASTTEQRSRHV